MKYSIFTVMAPGCTVEQIGEKLQAHGYDGVEWRVGRRVEEEPQPLPARAQWYWEYNRATLNLEDIEKEAAWAAAVGGTCERVVADGAEAGAAGRGAGGGHNGADAQAVARNV